MHYEIHIDENGMTRNASIDTNDRSIYKAAQLIIGATFAKEGAFVRFASVSYDPTTDSFRITEYSFNVKDGKYSDLKPSK